MKTRIALLLAILLGSLPLAALPLTTNDIATALDLPSNVSVISFNNVSDYAGWKVIEGSALNKLVVSGTVPIKNKYVLQAQTCEPTIRKTQQTAYITMQVKGAGSLLFNYRTSLDDYNAAEIYAFTDGNEMFGYEWGDSGWFARDNFLTGDWFWFTGSIFLDGASYTRKLQLAIKSPDGDPDLFMKPELWDNEVLLNMAWLDAFTWEDDPWAEFVTFYPNPEQEGTFSDSCDIDIDSSYGNLTFYYTTDGKKPTNKSNRYNSQNGITINKTTTIKVQAYEGSTPVGDVYEATYTARLTSPSYSPLNDQIGTAKIELTSPEADVTFFYTTDGSAPAYDSKGKPKGTTKSGNTLTLTKTCTVNAICHKAGQPDSLTSTFNITVTTPAPSITIPEEDFTGSVTATLAASGDCQYTVTYQGGQTTSGTGTSVTVSKNCTISATAQAAGQEISAAAVKRIFLPPTLTVTCDGQVSTTYVFESNASAKATATDGTAQFSQNKTTWATFPAAGKTTTAPVTWYFRTMPSDYNADSDHCCRLALVLQKTAPIDMSQFKDSLQNGWNLVSFPGQLSSNSVSALLQTARFFALENHILLLATDIAPGTAYFLFKDDTTVLPDQIQAVGVGQPDAPSGFTLVAPVDQTPLALPDLWKWANTSSKYLPVSSIPAYSGGWHHQK
jgi:hypothetical protein